MPIALARGLSPGALGLVGGFALCSCLGDGRIEPGSDDVSAARRGLRGDAPAGAPAMPVREPPISPEPVPAPFYGEPIVRADDGPGLPPTPAPWNALPSIVGARPDLVVLAVASDVAPVDDLARPPPSVVLRRFAVTEVIAGPTPGADITVDLAPPTDQMCACVRLRPLPGQTYFLALRADPARDRVYRIVSVPRTAVGWGFEVDGNVDLVSGGRHALRDLRADLGGGA